MAPKDETHIAQRLLSRAHSPSTSTKIFTEKIQLRPLLLKPSEASESAPDARTYRRNKRLASERKKNAKSKPMSAKERRATEIHTVPVAERKYELYEPLHNLWLGYIQEILNLGQDNFRGMNSGSAALLVSADYHGASIEVVRSRCPSRVGIIGIIIKDTKFSFEIITPKNALKIVPKEHTVFRFKVPFPKAGIDAQPDGHVVTDRSPLVFELHGNQFQYRAVDRANKKFRPHFLKDL